MLSRRESRHLALLVVAFVFVLIAMRRAAEPQLWARLFHLPMAAADQVDDLKPDAEDAARRPVRDAGAVAEDDAPPAAAGDGAAAGNADAPVTGCAEVDRGLLAPIEDKTGRRTADRAAIFQLMCVARAADAARLAKLARRDVSYPNLANDPDLYRGEPVHIAGKLARLQKWEGFGASNDYGFETVYEAWIYPPGFAAYAKEPLPYRVLVAEKPAGVEPFASLDEVAAGRDRVTDDTVSVDAYFLKQFAYRNNAGKAKWAPMLVGDRLVLNHVVKPDYSLQIALAGGAFVGLLGLAYAVYWVGGRRDDRLAAELRANAGGLPAPQFAEAGDAVPGATDRPDAAAGAVSGPPDFLDPHRQETS